MAILYLGGLEREKKKERSLEAQRLAIIISSQYLL